MARANFAQILPAAQLAANALALPARVQDANQQRAIERAFLQQNAALFGLDPAQIDTYAPEANLPGPVMTAVNKALGGVPGKLFGGVGEVGAILSSLLGGPLTTSAPRLPISSLLGVANLKATSELRKGQAGERGETRAETKRYHGEQERLAGERLDIAEQSRLDRAARAAAKAGAEAGTPSFERDLDAEAKRLGLTGDTKFSWKQDQRERMVAGRSGATAAGREPYRRPEAAPAPTAERDLDAEATRLGLTGDAKFRWKQQEREKAAGGRAGASAAAREPFQPLNAQVEKTLADVGMIHDLADDMLVMLDDPQVKANRGVFTGRLSQRLYQLGLSQPGEDPYLALAAQTKILGVQPYIRSTRHFGYIAQIQEHLPKPGDEEGLIRDKLAALKKLTEKLEHRVKQAAVMNKGAIRRELEQGQSATDWQKTLDSLGVPR